MSIAWLALLVLTSVFGLWLVMAVDGADRWGRSEVPGRRNRRRRAVPAGLAAGLLLGSLGACGSDESNSTSDGDLELDRGEGGSDDTGSGSGAPRNADEDDDEPAADSNGTSSPAPAAGNE